MLYPISTNKSYKKVMVYAIIAFAMVFILNSFLLQCNDSKTITKNIANKPLPNPKKDFATYMEVVTEKICYKVMDCEKRRYRTLPYNMQKELNPADCIKRILHDKEGKLARNTDEIRAIAPQCYRRILKANCKTYWTISREHSDCLHLRMLSEKHVQKK